MKTQLKGLEKKGLVLSKRKFLPTFEKLKHKGTSGAVILMSVAKAKHSPNY